MAHPVQDPRQRQQPETVSPENEAQASASPGVGRVPDTIGSPLERNDAPQSPKPGYVESAIKWITDWVSWIFKKVFFCWFPEPKPPEPPPPEEPLQPPPPPVILPPRLKEDIAIQVRLLDAFDRLTERQQNLIRREIGIDSYKWWFVRQWLSSYEAVGREKIDANPRILQGYFPPEPAAADPEPAV